MQCPRGPHAIELKYRRLPPAGLRDGRLTDPRQRRVRGTRPIRSTIHFEFAAGPVCAAMLSKVSRVGAYRGAARGLRAAGARWSSSGTWESDAPFELYQVDLDGERVTAEPNETILSLARRHGKSIPTLCDHPDLEPAALCRVCLVDIEVRCIPRPQHHSHHFGELRASGRASLPHAAVGPRQKGDRTSTKPACVTAVESGMKITTSSPDLDEQGARAGGCNGAGMAPLTRPACCDQSSTTLRCCAVATPTRA